MYSEFLKKIKTLTLIQIIVAPLHHRISTLIHCNKIISRNPHERFSFR